jgi:hypothetical protein
LQSRRIARLFWLAGIANLGIGVRVYRLTWAD